MAADRRGRGTGATWWAANDEPTYGGSSDSAGRVSSPEPRSSGGPANDAGPCGTTIGSGIGTARPWPDRSTGRGTSASVSGATTFAGGGMGIAVGTTVASSASNTWKGSALLLNSTYC